MPPICSICKHDKRVEIDSLLIRQESFRNIAKQFNVSSAALFRHRQHIEQVIVKSKEAEQESNADDLLIQLKVLRQRAGDILTKAEAEGDFKNALAAIREVRSCLELLAKLAGQLQERQLVNILISPEWLQIRTMVLEALEPYPDAKKELLKQLEVQ